MKLPRSRFPGDRGIEKVTEMSYSCSVFNFGVTSGAMPYGFALDLWMRLKLGRLPGATREDYPYCR